MSEIKQLPFFDDVANVFIRSHCEKSPSFAHGYWTGLICGGQAVSPKIWMNTLLHQKDAWESLDLATGQMFLDLAEVTVYQLSDIHYAFQLLLPDDDDPLEDRLLALTEWCAAFLIAFEAQEKEQPRPLLSEEAKEALVDLKEVSELSLTLKDLQEDEKDFMQVLEYVRMSVLLLHQEILHARSQGSVRSPYIH